MKHVTKAKKGEEKKHVVKEGENAMRQIFIEKVVLSCGAIGDNLTKAKKLLDLISASKTQVVASQKRIPDFDVRPGLEVGVQVTLRGKKAVALLNRLLGAIDNQLTLKQISANHFSFGIEEYIEIPGIEYQRDIGIRGLNVSVVFARKGLRVKRKKIKVGKVPKKQQVPKEEIAHYMREVFKTTLT